MTDACYADVISLPGCAIILEIDGIMPLSVRRCIDGAPPSHWARPPLPLLPLRLSGFALTGALA
eukprot:4867367-Prorocentrum_lima.AAC.1